MFSFVVSIVSILAGFLMIGFHIQQKTSTSSFSLAIFLMLYGLYGVSHYILMTTKDPITFVLFFNHFTPFYILTGTSVYLYVKKTINDETSIILKNKLFHLIPFIICVIDLSPYLFSSYVSKFQLANEIITNHSNFKKTPHLFFSDYWASIFRQLVNLGYFVAALILIYKPSNRTLSLYNNQKKVVYNWMKLLTISSVIFSTLMLLYLGSLRYDIFNDYIENTSDLYLHSTWIVHSSLIVTIFLYPSILYGIPVLKKENPLFDKLNTEHSGEEKKSIKTFKLEDEYLSKIDEIMKDYIKDAPYTKDKFSLSVLTSDTKIPMHHLNLYFKDYLNTSFNVWKNKLKIEFAVDLINSGILNQITIEALAMKSGFKSYSNFFTVFKDQMNVSPSDYIESLNRLAAQ